MRIETVPFASLSPGLIELWRDWVTKDARFHSPFLHPAFSQAVDFSSHDVNVAVAYNDGKPTAFLPFQSSRKHSAQPVGGFLSDRHGWISKPGTNVNVSKLIELTDINSFQFHMLPLEEIPELRCIALRRTVVHADLSGGFRAYVDRRKQLGSNVVSKLAQKERKLANEVGPLRLVEGFCEEAFESLLHWKKEACENRNVQNILGRPAARDTLHNLTKMNAPDFRCHFTRLMAGDCLVAVHLGMICHNRMAAWFPAFNPDYAKYSPGLLVLLQILRHCEQWGIQRVDFGNGELAFKDRFKTGETVVLEGIVDQSLFNVFFHFCWLRGRDWAKSSTFHPVLQRLWYHTKVRNQKEKLG